jgi:hypothetical protein
MEKLVCKKCNQERGSYFFIRRNYNSTNLEVQFDTNACKVCKNMKVKNPLNMKMKTTTNAVNKAELTEFINRIERNRTRAKDCDIVPLVNLFTSIYQQHTPIFIDKEDEYSFMYLKIKEYYDKQYGTYFHNGRKFENGVCIARNV